MADDKMSTAWDKAEKAIAKGKGDSALKILREIDSDGSEATTLRLAGHAAWWPPNHRSRSLGGS